MVWQFRFRFGFGRKLTFIFGGGFVFGRKRKTYFRSVFKLLIYQQVHFPQHCSLEWEYSWESGEAVGCKRKKYPDFAFRQPDKGRCNVQFQVQFQQIYWPHVLFIVWRCIPGLSPLQVVQNPTSQHWLLGDNPATQSIAVQPPVLLHSARHSSTVVAAEDRSPKPP